MKHTSCMTRKKNGGGGILGVLFALSSIVGPAVSTDERELLTPFQASLAFLTVLKAPVIDPSYHQGWDCVIWKFKPAAEMGLSVGDDAR